MVFLDLWLITFAFSFGVEAIYELSFLKKAADYGYKINMDELPKLNFKFGLNIMECNLFIFLIPILNVISVLKKCIKYNGFMHILLENLDSYGVLINMSKKEKDMYKKKANGLTSFLISLKDSDCNKNVSSISKEDVFKHNIDLVKDKDQKRALEILRSELLKEEEFMKVDKSSILVKKRKL